MRLAELVALAARTPESQLRAATKWLLARQSADGWWRDFQLAPGRSDEWVTGYVAAHLAEVIGAATGLDREVSDAVTAAWLALQSRQRVRSDGAWGYNELVPQDADSTAWALACAEAAGAADSPAAHQGLQELRRFIGPSGASTYRDDTPIRRFIGAGDERSLLGWTQPHVCVTAAASRHPALRAELVPVLLDAQRDDGHWSSYWWPSASYATALACRVVRGESRARAGAWAADRSGTRSEQTGAVAAPGFELANLASVLLDAEVEADAVTPLLQEQLPEGNWIGGAVMRVPDPAEALPDRVDHWQHEGLVEGSEIVDDAGVFTTATAVAALARWACRR